MIEQIMMFHMAVTDMAKAKEFYADKLGFQVTKDFGKGDQHWVSLTLPGGGASLNLTTMYENMQPGTMKMYATTKDLKGAYKALVEKGVKPTSEIATDPWGTWFGVSDPDGNRWLIVEKQ